MAHLSNMTTEKYFLGRQPILDRYQCIAGYELLFRSADISYAIIDDYSLASARVILNTLTEFGIGEILGKHLGFFNVDTEMLMSDHLELLPREQVVIELLETIEFSETVIDRCVNLKKKGFVLALDDNIYSHDSIPLYEKVDIVKVDILQISAEELPEMVACFKRWPLKLLAEKVETSKQFSLCQELGFELYQGYYFARPSVIQHKRLDNSRITLMNLLNQIIAEADIKAVEECFRKNPNLTYNLLRLVNSVAIGLREKIRSLRHALMVLGENQLLRWITLALFTCKENGKAASPMLEIAVVRGRLLELLVQARGKSSGETDYPERAFITGILSLADVLFETSMEEILDHLNLTEDVRGALISSEGHLGGLLRMLEKLERNEFGAVSQLLGIYDLTTEELMTAQMSSIGWANGLREFM
jgi:EAL and modified HD-GYP domain-containing signal transduction protein